MALDTLAYLYCTQEDVEDLLSAYGLSLALDDDGDGNVSAAELRALTKARNRATEGVNYWLWQKYSAANLSKSNLVNGWATSLAAYECRYHRGNPPPEILADLAEQANERMKEIRDGPGMLPNIALRRDLAPRMSNVRASPAYTFKVVRVQRVTSSKQAMTRPQHVDHRAENYYEI